MTPTQWEVADSWTLFLAGCACSALALYLGYGVLIARLIQLETQ